MEHGHEGDVEFISEASLTYLGVETWVPAGPYRLLKLQGTLYGVHRIRDGRPELIAQMSAGELSRLKAKGRLRVGAEIA